MVSIMGSLRFFQWLAMLSLSVLTLTAYCAPEVQKQGDVSFVAGGVGVTEAQEIKALAGSYSLEIMFVVKSVPNRYLAGIEVEIKDNKRKTVLKTLVQGPYLLVNLPKGNYTVHAANGASVRQQSVTVGGKKSRRAVFLWNQQVDS